MIVYKNLTSGKNFIFLQETGNDEGLFITPPNEKGEVAIKSLKFHLFVEELSEDDEPYLIMPGGAANVAHQMKNFNVDVTLFCFSDMEAAEILLKKAEEYDFDSFQFRLARDRFRSKHGYRLGFTRTTCSQD